VDVHVGRADVDPVCVALTAARGRDLAVDRGEVVAVAANVLVRARAGAGRGAPAGRDGAVQVR
jgi:hypothetical protein